MKRPPSDYELLKAIYERHRADFTQSRPVTQTGILLPIDIPAVAATLGSDADTVFGRLYYHLDQVYGEAPRDDGSPRKVLFTPVAGDEVNCVNVPLLEAVLAGLWQERKPPTLGCLGLSDLGRGRARRADRLDRRRCLVSVARVRENGGPAAPSTPRGRSVAQRGASAESGKELPTPRPRRECRSLCLLRLTRLDHSRRRSAAARFPAGEKEKARLVNGHAHGSR